MRSRSSLGTALIAGVAACALAEPARAALPSYSKISVHLIINYTPGAATIIAAHPKLLKILDLYGGMIPAARAYKAGTPNGIIVLRIYTTKSYTNMDDPVACANDFWNTVLAPPINSLSPSDRALIDYVEGPNEGDGTPTWGSVQDAQWYNTFWVTLAPLIANAGFKPCAFSISVGNPPGDTTYWQQMLSAIVPALRTCKQLGGAWSYHPYTLPYTTDINNEIWYSLRYRKYYDYFRTNYPDLADLPMILTEGGVDGQTAPGGPGWTVDTVQRYEDWLTWYDQQIRQDRYIIGCTLFEQGNPGSWPSFDVEPISDWLATHIATALPPPTIACDPASISASVLVNETATQTFTVTNTGSGTLNYTLAGNAGWLSLSPTSGSSTGEADTITATFSAVHLNAGTYSTNITVSDPNASNSPQLVTATLTVTSPIIPGDFDGNGSVDSSDLATFLGCMTGPELGPPAEGCAAADLDHDNDVDQQDFGLFQRCLSGAGYPADPNCAN